MLTGTQLWQIVIVCLAVALLLAFLLWYMWMFSSRKVHEAEVVASQLRENKATHGRIIGYLCHNVRNPLHVLRTWMPDAMEDGQQPLFDVPEEEHAAVQEDMAAAVAQIEVRFFCFLFV